MDLISSILQGVRVEAPLLSQIRVGGDATIDMEHADGAPFHFVIYGTTDLLLGDDVHALSAGDIALLPYWDRYSLQFGAGGPPLSITEMVETMELLVWSTRHGLDQPLQIDIGTRTRRTQVLSGIVGIRPQEAGLMTAAFPPIIIFRRHHPVLEPTIQATMSLLRRELQTPEPGFAAAAARSLELLFVQALREWLLRAEHPPGLARGVSHPNIRRALEAIYAMPEKQWDLRMLARLAGQSRSAFAATFLHVTGETPFAHLRRVRVHRAAALLGTSRKSIPEIAAQFGYANVNSFRRTFHAHMGTTASAYRRSVSQAV